MKLKRYKVEVTGIRPMLLRNGRTADPLDPYAQQIKKITQKKSKTDDDYRDLGELEFMSGLYWSDDIGLYMPADNLQRMFLDGAKKIKRGRDTSAAMIDEEFGAQIITDGHMDLEKLKANPRFRHRGPARIRGSTTIRVRPMVPTGWKMAFHILLDETLMNFETMEEILHICSSRIGMGDWRPGAPKVPGTFGKFIVDSIKPAKHNA